MNHALKHTLDQLLKHYQAQPVGDGYMDVIVARHHYQAFAKALLLAGFNIEAVTWWEHLTSLDMKNTYGMGGPVSQYSTGWFAEVCIDMDAVKSTGDVSTDLKSIILLVEHKVVTMGDGTVVSFQTTPSLTPAFCIKVDASWTNLKA